MSRWVLRPPWAWGEAARWYAEPRSLVDLRALIEACDLLSIPRVMLGRGSNLIVPDEGYSGLVIRMKGPSWSRISRRSDDSMIVGAGARLKGDLPAGMQGRTQRF